MEDEHTIRAGSRRKRVIIVFLVCVLVGIGVIAFWPEEREPQYNGKKLSEWLELSRSVDRSDRSSAEDAVRKIGTNALPWLVKWLNYDTPAWKNMLGNFWPFNRAPRRVQKMIWARENRSWHASRGFGILRGRGSPAIPDLARMITNYPGQSSWLAIDSLGQIGGDAIWPLFQVATNKANAIQLRQFAFGALATGRFPKVETDEEHMSPLFPLLIPCLHENGLEEPTMRLIGRLSLTPDVALYISTNAITSPSAEVRVQAIHWGAKIATNTAPLIPEFKKCLQDSDMKVRQEATNAFKKIAPEMLTNRVKEF